MKFQNPNLNFEWAYVQTTYYLFPKLIKPDFPFSADEIAEPRPDMNIKLITFTVTKKLYNTVVRLSIAICLPSSLLSTGLYLKYRNMTENC